MGNLYLIPEWFFKYTIAFELIFGLITLIVGIYALKIYKLSNQKQTKNFGIAFIFISIAYFIQAILNSILFSKLYTERIIALSTFNLWSNIGIFLYMFFFLAGLITLVYVTFNINSFRVYSLLFLLILGSMIVTPFKLNIFHIFTSILLIYIVVHYFLNYIKNKQLKNFLVLVAFTLLLFGNIDLIFSLNNSIYYVIADIISLIAYIIILINLILIARKK
ncbi:hypothetical protein HYU23_03685 [Candidatus Woesearchaeota archaeon]|nr:hypothetical protein [Candidatus Woesearchaeota archaeon]